ncbi:hypothetical protein CBM2634_P170004 [Cupriavidus taiwanensis]|uniref:Uncharacterized protein n=1 Tax=Cupriavidus taiwanensis TaxID=164546 RepID=A0A375JAQ9_9BURK|nr:hypothetical protein CBM2634_P170004 [Cupriavidus taiwanensis]
MMAPVRVPQPAHIDAWRGVGKKTGLPPIGEAPHQTGRAFNSAENRVRGFDKLLFTRHRTGPIENHYLNAADFAPGLKQQLTVKAQQFGPSS